MSRGWPTNIETKLAVLEAKIVFMKNDVDSVLLIFGISTEMDLVSYDILYILTVDKNN